jgi:hypothetical protein
MRFLLIHIFCLLIITSVNAQQLPVDHWDNIDADVLGNFYVSKGSELLKFQIDGKVTAEYQDKLLGDIDQIDCYKGLKILVFHNTSNTVVLLNSQLAPIGQSIDLSDGNFYDVAAVCLGADDQLWIADEQSGQLKLVDPTLHVIQTGVVFRQYTSAEKIEQFAKRGNLLLMVTSDAELLVFDDFGSFVSKHSFKKLDFSWIGIDRLLYLTNRQVFGFSYKWNSFDTISTSDNPINGVLESKNQLYLLEDNRIKKIKK